MRARSKVQAAAPAVSILAIAAILLLLPPARSRFYPRCPIYSMLHLQCPGCGGTRAAAALLHGCVHEALHNNALVTLLLPFAITYGIVAYLRWLRGTEMLWPRLHPVALPIVSAAAVVFTVVRNLALR